MDRKRVAAVIISEDRVLMVRERGRTDSGRHEGTEYWTLPGGGVDDNETPEAAVVREVFEETGLRARNPRFVFRFPYVSGWTDAFAVDFDDSELVIGVEDLDCDCPRIVGLDWVLLDRSLGLRAIPTLCVAAD